MASVANLYNPFRDVKAEEDTNNSHQPKGKSDPFAAFTFEINQIVDFPSPDGLTKKKGGAADPQSPDFDPFQVVVVSPDKPNEATATTTTTTTTTSKPKAAITPKLVVQLSTHEEVTSKMKMDLDDFDATSEVTIEGTVYAQVQCSDALKNAPFALLVPNSTTSNSNQFASKPTNFHIRPNDTYATTSRFGAGVNQNAPLLVTIPKQDQLPVPIATYSLQQEVRFMPVLVERKITRNGTRVRIAVQIRSRLDNAGDMKDMTILVSVPEKVNGATLQLARGNGVWDELKRTIKWKFAHLVKGQSELVVAEADLWNAPGVDEDETPFPVMFRCSSISDSITSLDWKVAQVSGSPSHLTAAAIKRDFRILHRLP